MSASAWRAPVSAVTSAWVRMAVVPVATSMRAARSARSSMSTRLQRPRTAPMAAMAPSRSPVGLGTRSAVNALSRWAWGSAMAGSTSLEPRSTSVAGPSTTAAALATAGPVGRAPVTAVWRVVMRPSSTVMSTRRPSASRALRRMVVTGSRCHGFRRSWATD